MIRSLTTRSRLLGRAIEQWLSNQVSQSRWVTVVFVMTFGVFLMLPGGALAIIWAWSSVEYLERYNPHFLGTFPKSATLRATMHWIVSLGMLFGGNFLRSLAFADLRHRTTVAGHRSIDQSPPKSTSQRHGPFNRQASRKRLRPATAILFVCVGPILILPGVVLLLESLTPFWQVFVYQPPQLWLRAIAGELSRSCSVLLLLWLVSAATLAGSIGLPWIGFRSLFVRAVMGD